jgi:hypothetical protein
LDRLNQEIDDEYEYRETGCDERTIESESMRFQENTGLTLDAEYLALMSVTNGVMFNGMTIFPLRKHEHCDEPLHMLMTICENILVINTFIMAVLTKSLTAITFHKPDTKPLNMPGCRFENILSQQMLCSCI